MTVSGSTCTRSPIDRTLICNAILYHFQIALFSSNHPRERISQSTFSSLYSLHTRISHHSNSVSRQVAFKTHVVVIHDHIPQQRISLPNPSSFLPSRPYHSFSSSRRRDDFLASFSLSPVFSFIHVSSSSSRLFVVFKLFFFFPCVVCCFLPSKLHLVCFLSSRLSLP